MGVLARVAPRRARLARRRAPGEERADRRLDLARGRALYPLRAQRDRHGDARRVGAPVPGRPAGAERRIGRLPSKRRASRHAIGGADGRVPPRAGGLGEFLGHEFRILAPEELARIYPLARMDRLLGAIHEPDDGHIDPTPCHERACRRSPVAGRRDPAPRAGAGDRARRIGRLGGPYRPGQDPEPARRQRGPAHGAARSAR